MAGIGVRIRSASSRSSIIGLNRRKFMDADPSVYDSFPRKMKKEVEKRGGSGGGGNGGGVRSNSLCSHILAAGGKSLR